MGLFEGEEFLGEVVARREVGVDGDVGGGGFAARSVVAEQFDAGAVGDFGFLGVDEVKQAVGGEDA